jgi:hypothetical protein
MRVLLTCTILLFSFCWTNSIGQIYVKNILHDTIPFDVEGKPIDAYKFNDALGTHYFIATKIKDTIINKTTFIAYKYTDVNKAFKENWQIKDFADEILLYYTYTKIIDIDGDGILETVFIYQLNPDYGEGSDWKLMLFYKDKKCVLKAHVPELDSDKYSVTLSKSFDTVPTSVKEFAIDYWKKIVNEQKLKTN